MFLGRFDCFAKPFTPAVLKAGKTLRTVERLLDVGIVMTLVGGKIVYEGWGYPLSLWCIQPSYVTHSMKSCRAEQRFFRLLRYPLQGLLTFPLDTPRAWPFDQIHGQVCIAQFRDKVCGDYLPGAGSWAPDPIVTIDNTSRGECSSALPLFHFKNGASQDAALTISARACHPTGCRAAAPKLPPWLPLHGKIR